MNGLLQELHTALSYNPEDGTFTWLFNRSRGARSGTVAGTLQKSGYVAIGFKGKYYKAHRLAWLFVYGAWPKTDLDHINRITHDNRIVNLRECTPSQNQANRSNNKNSSTGYRGVTFHKRLGKFQAAIRINRKPIHLGTFDTAEDASQAYASAAIAHFGSFAARHPQKETA